MQKQRDWPRNVCILESVSFTSLEIYAKDGRTICHIKLKTAVYNTLPMFLPSYEGCGNCFLIETK